MQVVRDAIVFLVVVLVLVTVRVSPIPEIELSPAQAAQETTRPAVSVETPHVAAPAPALVDPAPGVEGDDRENAPCPGSMASRSKAQPGPADPAQPPCHV